MSNVKLVGGDKRYVVWDSQAVCVDDPGNIVLNEVASDEPITQFGPARSAKVLIKDASDFMGACLSVNKISAVMTFRAIVCTDSAWKITQSFKAHLDTVYYNREEGIFAYYASSVEAVPGKRSRESPLELDRNGAKKFMPDILRVHGYGWQVELGKTENIENKTLSFHLAQSVTADPVVCYLVESFVLTDYNAGEQTDVQKNMYVILANMMNTTRWFYAYILRNKGHDDLNVTIQWADSTNDRRIKHMNHLLRLYSERLAACQQDGLQHVDDVWANAQRKTLIAKLNEWIARNHSVNGGA